MLIEFFGYAQLCLQMVFDFFQRFSMDNRYILVETMASACETTYTWNNTVVACGSVFGVFDKWFA